MVTLDLGWALHPMTSVLVSRGEDTHRHRRKGHVRMEARIGMMWPQAKGCQGLPGATRNGERGMRRIPPPSLPKEPIISTQWFCTSIFQACDRIISLVSSHPVRGNLWGNPTKPFHEPLLSLMFYELLGFVQISQDQLKQAVYAERKQDKQ